MDFSILEDIGMQKYIVAALLAGLAGTAAAERYVGIGAGASHFKVDCAGLDRCDKSDVGVKFFGGYRYTPMLSVEAGYIDFGKSKSTGTQDGFQLEGVLKSQALLVNAAVKAPLVAGVDGVARIGLARVHASLDQRADGNVISSTTRESWQPYVGLGLQYKVRQDVSVDLGVDMTRAKVDTATGSTTSAVRLVNAGVTYGF